MVISHSPVKYSYDKNLLQSRMLLVSTDGKKVFSQVCGFFGGPQDTLHPQEAIPIGSGIRT